MNKESPCKKVSYGSKKFADNDIAIITKKSTRTKVPIRSYLCDKCNTWHLTGRVDYKQVITDQAERINKQKDFIESVKFKINALANENDSLKKRLDELIWFKKYNKISVENFNLIKKLASLKNTENKILSLENKAEKYFTLLTKQNDEAKYLYNKVKALLPEHEFLDFQERFDLWRKENLQIKPKSKLKSMTKKDNQLKI